MFYKGPALAGFLAAVIAATGCGGGDGRQKVSGAVTYKDEAIKSGIISFVPKGSTAPAGGSPITDGRYEIPASAGLPPGEYDVVISVPTAAPPKDPDDEEGPGVGGEKETAETLPAKYNSNTELRAEIKAGEKNEFDFHLK